PRRAERRRLAQIGWEVVAKRLHADARYQRDAVPEQKHLVLARNRTAQPRARRRLAGLEHREHPDGVVLAQRLVSERDEERRHLVRPERATNQELAPAADGALGDVGGDEGLVARRRIEALALIDEVGAALGGERQGPGGGWGNGPRAPPGARR